MSIIDYSRDERLTDFAKATLKDRYLLDTETSPQEGFLRACRAWASNEAHAERLYDYVSKGWFSFSTPKLSNAPVRLAFAEKWEDNWDAELFEDTKIGLPISCFLNYVPDSRGGLGEHYTENIWLASNGGGIGGYWGTVRSDGTSTSHGSESTGSIPFMKIVDSQMLAFSQGKTRRGSYAVYQDISHPEVLEFLDIRKPTSGDINRKCLNLHHGINITNKFMRLVDLASSEENIDDSWDLIDPHTNKVVSTISAKILWQRILENRVSTGEPYITFIDTINEALPASQKKLGLTVKQSNLCTEIVLVTSPKRTAVCALSSVNTYFFDEWKNNIDFIPDLVEMIDNGLEYFIHNAPEEMWRAVNSAKAERSIGLGQLGFHSLLQKKGIPFESALATSLNRQIAKHIYEEAIASSSVLAEERGEPSDMEGTGRRNAHLIAIAPNASSAIIAGVSPSIELIVSNIFTQKTLSGSFTVKNKELEKLLEEKYDKNTREIWKQILGDNGSVRSLEFLTDYEKDIFKTAQEVDQRWIIDHAGDRQPYICQAQSINIFVPANVDILYLHKIHMRAWKHGLKSLYYCRSNTLQRADIISKIERVKLDDEECLSCQ